MTELRRRMKEDLQLAGYSPRTIASYIDTVRVLANYYHRSPDLITEDEIRRFFLYMINERKSSASSITVYLCGIKFFYETTLKRTWRIFDLIKPPRNQEIADSAVTGGSADYPERDCQSSLPHGPDHHLCLRSAHFRRNPAYGQGHRRQTSPLAGT